MNETHSINDESKLKRCVRCITCRKKLKLISHDCPCGIKGLCTTCMNPSVHECTVNYQSLHQEELRKKNPLVIGEKIVKC